MKPYFFQSQTTEEHKFITSIKGNKDHSGQVCIFPGKLIMFPSLEKKTFNTLNHIETEDIDFNTLKREVLKFNLSNRGVIQT